MCVSFKLHQNKMYRKFQRYIIINIIINISRSLGFQFYPDSLDNTLIMNNQNSVYIYRKKNITFLQYLPYRYTLIQYCKTYTTTSDDNIECKIKIKNIKLIYLQIKKKV